MLNTVLDQFSPGERLILVSDPDDLLAEESILAELSRRDFRLIAEDDPVALRCAYEQTQTGDTPTSVIVITPGPLNALPYDLWQQGLHVELALHQFFPNLDYPTLRTLSPAQRVRLAWHFEGTEPPTQRLSPLQSQDYLLQAVFDARPDALARPASLLLWLADYHARNDPMPPALQRRLLTQLQGISIYADWPLAELLVDAEAYRAFVQTHWEQYVNQTLRESSPVYRVQPLDFTHDHSLQDALPRLVRDGVVTPLDVVTHTPIPAWAQPAVAVDVAGVRARQVRNALMVLQDQLNKAELRWEQWQIIARNWAQLLLWRFDPDYPLLSDLLSAYDQAQARLDQRFGDWLSRSYASLATRRLPKPHHLFHVPGYLAHTREPGQRVALLILDGMALADWLLIRRAWQERHIGWRMQEQLLMAQIPSITAVSRQALISGLRPIDFADTLTHNRNEGRHWQRFWRTQGLPENAAVLTYLPNRVGEPYPAGIDSLRTQALCCISPVIDKMLHGATQGAGDVLASIRVWLEGSPTWLEGLIQELLGAAYTVYLTSDHGHVGVVGMGQPQEGVTVETRSKRARIYDNEDFANSVRGQFPETILWHDDGLLPSGRWVLIPTGRRAFGPRDVRVVSHGGLTIEEIVVPVVTIRGASEHE